MARTQLFRRLERLWAAANPPHGPAAGPRDVTRRDALLLLGGASLSALSLGSGLGVACSPRVPARSAANTTTERIAIVGGGIAGLHAAYRLQQAGAKATLYEASPRLGGRIFSNRTQFGEQVAELGGEFIDSEHITLHALAREFGIALSDRAAGTSAAGAAALHDVWWLDGRSVPEALLHEQLSRVAPLIHDMIWRVEEKQDSALFDTLDKTSLEAWLAEHMPPSELPELHTALTVAYRGEFGREPREQSCLNLLYLISGENPSPGFHEFGTSDERYFAKGGNQSFIDAFQARLTQPIELGTRLQRIAGNGPYELEFRGASGAKRLIIADRVVLTLPFSVLRELDTSALALPQQKRSAIAELGYGTNAKLMGGFRERVWQHTGHSGSVVANRDWQQCWDTSLGQKGDHGLLTNFIGGDAALLAEEISAEEQFSRFTTELEAIHPRVRGTFIVGSALRMAWQTMPFSRGSYSCYLPGQWRFWGTEGQRVHNVHFAGEHTSLEFQGYMEGAAESGARVAGEIMDDLGLAPSDVHGALLAFERGLPPARTSTPCLGQRRRARQELLALLVDTTNA